MSANIATNKIKYSFMPNRSFHHLVVAEKIKIGESVKVKIINKDIEIDAEITEMEARSISIKFS